VTQLVELLSPPFRDLHTGQLVNTQSLSLSLF
jgi:hypothetical protein